MKQDDLKQVLEEII